MRLFSPSLTAWVIVVGSCLVWTGAVSMGLVHFLDLTASTGWLIAGFLGFIATLLVAFILHGMKHAGILTEHAKSHRHLFHARPKSTSNGSGSGAGHPRH